MRNYLHNPDLDVFRSNLAAARERLMPAREWQPDTLARKGAQFAVFNFQNALECAFLSHALELPDGTAGAFLREAAWSMERALSAGAILDLSEFTDAWSVALVLRDAELGATLGRLERARYEHPEVQFDEILFVLAEAQAAIVQRAAAAATARLDAAARLMASGRLPGIAAREAASLHALLDALQRSDQPAFAQALAARLAHHLRIYRRPALASAATGAFDLRALGIAALARARGLAVDLPSPYLPLELLAA